MGRFGTAVPSDPAKPLAEELVMLGRLIGTDHPRGRAEARGIVERAMRDLAELLTAARSLAAQVNAHLDYEDDSEMEAASDALAEALAAIGTAPSE